ncbi:MAG: SDR family NAD(P)-dependent oxidoreductase [Calditrichaceae bacterium]
MRPLAIITGAGSGIGKALTLRLAEKNVDVIAVGRRISKLESTQKENPARIKIVQADVGNDDGREKIVKAIPSGQTLKYLVHNAAVLDPVIPLSRININDWRIHQAINVEGPLFLTQKLLPSINGGRILHISSGAAHHPYSGWGAYSTSKAALYMLYLVLREELKDSDIRIGSIRPGVVDTPMQDKIREVPESDFPALQKFINLKEQNKLSAPSIVAKFISWILLETADDEFSAREWDIRDESHQEFWMED